MISSHKINLTIRFPEIHAYFAKLKETQSRQFIYTIMLELKTTRSHAKSQNPLDYQTAFIKEQLGSMPKSFNLKKTARKVIYSLPRYFWNRLKNIVSRKYRLKYLLITVYTENTWYIFGHSQCNYSNFFVRFLLKMCRKCCSFMFIFFEESNFF